MARSNGRGGSTIDSATQLRTRLKALGLADPAVEAAWPRWWSDDAEASPSARAELRFGVARRLGLDPGSLLDDDEQPRFLWRQEARFKRLTSENDVERAGIASFGRAVASAVAAATSPLSVALAGRAALDLRQQLLADDRPFVALGDLIALSWGVGIPVVHLRIFPWPQKRMDAMTLQIADRSFILLGKDAVYPAWIAFYLAHELAHIALGHLGADEAVIDLDRESAVADEADDEEQHADAWALELLTGRSEPTVVSADGRSSASELARVALAAGPQLAIEPGTLALCFGYSTGNWAVANASLKGIYSTPTPVWRAINTYARRQMTFQDSSPDAADFLSEVLELGNVA